MYTVVYKACHRALIPKIHSNLCMHWFQNPYCDKQQQQPPGYMLKLGQYPTNKLFANGTSRSDTDNLTHIMYSMHYVFGPVFLHKCFMLIFHTDLLSRYSVIMRQPETVREVIWRGFSLCSLLDLMWTGPYFPSLSLRAPWITPSTSHPNEAQDAPPTHTVIFLDLIN